MSEVLLFSALQPSRNRPASQCIRTPKRGRSRPFHGRTGIRSGKRSFIGASFYRRDVDGGARIRCMLRQQSFVDRKNAQIPRSAQERPCVPLRGEQLRTYGDEILTVAGLLNEGLLESEFVPFDSEMLSSLPDGDVHETEKHRFVRLGKKSRELLPALVRLMSRQEPLGEWSCQDVTTLRCGGSLIRLGRPELDVGCFEKVPAIRQLALIPHYSARGPNGAWLLRRGPTHPDVVAIANRHAFLSITNGGPDLVNACSNYWSSVRILELDESEEEAKKRLAGWQDPDDEPSKIIQMKGRELLELICGVDVIEVGDQQLAVNWAGRSYLEQEHAAAALPEIIAALPMLTCELGNTESG
ncbi:hypothetical protein D3C78_320980 [compost metagenome]